MDLCRLNYWSILKLAITFQYLLCSLRKTKLEDSCNCSISLTTMHINKMKWQKATRAWTSFSFKRECSTNVSRTLVCKKVYVVCYTRQPFNEKIYNSLRFWPENNRFSTKQSQENSFNSTIGVRGLDEWFIFSCNVN